MATTRNAKGASRFNWTSLAAWSPIAIVAATILYILVFSPAWHEDAADIASVKGQIVHVVPQQSPAPPRDYYELTCNRSLALRRLWAIYVKNAGSIGQVHTLVDQAGWVPVRGSWHAAATAMQEARKVQPSTGTDADTAFPISDPAAWFPFAFYQSPAASAPERIIVSEFRAPGNPVNAETLKLQLRACRW